MDNDQFLQVETATLNLLVSVYKIKYCKVPYNPINLIFGRVMVTIIVKVFFEEISSDRSILNNLKSNFTLVCDYRLIQDIERNHLV